AEDGIRDFHVTGVQTCALPISNLEPMEPFTVLLIVLAVLATLTLVWLQYFHKNPRKGSTNYILAALRFISILSGLLLLIAPTFEIGSASCRERVAIFEETGAQR